MTNNGGEMTERELGEILARVDAATAGPWEWHGDSMHAVAVREFSEQVAHLGVWQVGEPGPRLIDTDCGTYGPCPADRAFIAHARADVPALVEEVKRLRALVEALEGKKPKPHDWPGWDAATDEQRDAFMRNLRQYPHIGGP